MNDKGKIITGLLIFFIIFTFPFWYNRGKAASVPEPVLSPAAKKAGVCVRSKDYIRVEHMQLLDDWRDTVVRDGKRTVTNKHGREFEMSLSNTCLECHDNKPELCDRYHV